MIKSTSAEVIRIKIKGTSHVALQADSVTPLKIVGECHLTLTRGGVDFRLDALVVNDLDVDVGTSISQVIRISM